MRAVVVVTIIVALAALSLAQTPPASFPPFPSVVSGDAFGYVPLVNATAGMFYWLVESANTSAPLVMWLQGGPGASSVAGSFLENGIFNMLLEQRQTAWPGPASMLYVDNPVGTGWSYVESNASLSTTDWEIADNLVQFLITFLSAHPDYSGRPFYVFSESYGGKMAARFGQALQEAIKQGLAKVNFAGVALGDGWVSPVDCMASYAEYMLATGLINRAESKDLLDFAESAQKALDEGNGELATQYWGEQQEAMMKYTGNVSVYNILEYPVTAGANMTALMDGPVRAHFGSTIPSFVSFGSQGGAVFGAMAGDFMKPAYDSVQYLFDEGISVNVYNGQLDLIVDTLCTEAWIDRLHIGNYAVSPRLPFYDSNSTLAGYVQKWSNFAFWQIADAGHMVPLDNGAAALQLLKNIIGA